MKILKFSTPSCTYCKVVSHLVDGYAKNKGYEVQEVNADSDTNDDKDKELTEAFEVMSVPVVVLGIEGDKIENATKLTGLPEIMSFINQ